MTPILSRPQCVHKVLHLLFQYGLDRRIPCLTCCHGDGTPLNIIRQAKSQPLQLVLPVVFIERSDLIQALHYLRYAHLWLHSLLFLVNFASELVLTWHEYYSVQLSRGDDVYFFYLSNCQYRLTRCTYVYKPKVNVYHLSKLWQQPKAMLIE